MDLLKQAILDQGIIINENILKVDAILNHQIDPLLMDAIAQSFYEYFKEKGITRVITIESSGIAPALLCALKLNVPLTFLKKDVPSTMRQPLTATVTSFTKNKTYTLCADASYIHKTDRVLFIDDFLANGEAFKGAEDLIIQVGATIIGIGIVIDKAFQSGKAYIKEKGYDYHCLASIASMKKNAIEFI